MVVVLRDVDHVLVDLGFVEVEVEREDALQRARVGNVTRLYWYHSGWLSLLYPRSRNAHPRKGVRL